MSNMINIIIRPQGTKYVGTWSTEVPDEVRQKLRHSKVSGDSVEIEEEYLKFLSPVCYTIVDKEMKVEIQLESEPELTLGDNEPPSEFEEDSGEGESKPRRRSKKSTKS